MKIHLPAYPPGIHRISESVEPAELDLDRSVFGAPVQAELRLDRHDPYLQFEFDLQTVVHLECDRCLTSFQQPLHVQAPMLYVLGRPAHAESVDDPEIVYVPANTTDLDITTDVRDFLILGLPERRLCSEDCRGLCPQCGADLNTQPCEHIPAPDSENHSIHP